MSGFDYFQRGFSKKDRLKRQKIGIGILIGVLIVSIVLSILFKIFYKI